MHKKCKKNEQQTGNLGGYPPPHFFRTPRVGISPNEALRPTAGALEPQHRRKIKIASTHQPSTYYFVSKELPTKSYPKITQNARKKALAKGAREARPFVAEAFFIAFCVILG